MPLISLDTIVISNFKSFSGRITVGPIQPFTTIIGSNGSGKSNIMDAIRFALGENASSLRVKRLSELIYGGYTVGKSMKDTTYVNVIFKIDGKTKKSFTRKIYGEIDQYRIDDKSVTNVFYKTELQKMGLDIKAGNFLIPQGYIECFAMKMPKDLTVMFEKTSNSNAHKADYERLKLELLKAEEEVYFEHQMKKQILTLKKNTIMEKAETERYLKLKEQYNVEKLKFQSIRLLLVKEETESLQDEEKEIKSQIDKYLRDKKAAIFLMERRQSQFKSLSNSLEGIEQDILKVENIIHQKRIEHVVLAEDLLCWQKKCDSVRVSLDSASKAHDINKKTIQELKDELNQINNELIKLKEVSQTSIIELSDSQVKRYMELANEAEYQAKNFVKQIKSVMRDQQENHDKLDNENRRTQELEDKVKQITLTKENLETRLKRLQDSSVEHKATLLEKTAKQQEISQKLIEAKNKSFNLENEIAKISEELSQADFDNDIISQQLKRNKTIKMLKQFHSGVYGRLSDLCKPIHSRYNVAITKVFGKNMYAIVVDTKYTAIQCIKFLKEQKVGIETFLPLDSIKKIFLKEQLRTIKEPKNVKLLYDLLNISSTQINKAVLFVTKNILVSETMEDARIIAHESDKQKANDCISLDGCFYRKDGTLSGGQADLIVKAKQWEKQQILTLKEQKAQLMQEFRDLPKISELQSEFDIVNVQIQGLTLQNKYIEIDIKDTEDEIVKLHDELDMFDRKIIILNMAISEIQDNIQKQVKKAEKLERYVNAIKDKIFVEFCNDINVPNINYYEQNNLRIYREHEKRQMEFKKQCDRIENRLNFENESDIESKVLKWTRALEHADAELNKIYQKERHAKINIEREEIKMLKLKNNYTNMKNDLENMEKKLAQHKSQIDVIGKLYLETQKAHIAIQKKIEQKKIECNTILKECKMEDFIIPMYREQNSSLFASSSSSNTQSSDSCKILTKINFSQFPEDICNCTKENLQDMAKQLNEKLMKIQDEFSDIINPNLKVDEKIDSIAQQIQETIANLRNCRDKCDTIKTQFESVKAKRYKLFSDCLESVGTEIDCIYKSLVNDTSAQAIILPDNPEEPYAGNIIYNCIVPHKGFQPLQYLSGGEKSLASLALLFAIQRYKKIPFLIMDEGDAALDKTNIKNVIRFIQSQINTMQFITISLHKELCSSADILIGVTIQHDIKGPRSKVFAISLSKYRKSEKFNTL